jgi:hypothetical protein
MTRALMGTCAVLAVLCAVQWATLGRMKADMRVVDARAYQAALVDLDDRREEIERALTWLDAHVRSAPAQGRTEGLCRDGVIDVKTIGELLFDAYLKARAEGASEAEARAEVVAAMRASPDGLQ